MALYPMLIGRHSRIDGAHYMDGRARMEANQSKNDYNTEICLLVPRKRSIII